MAVNSLEPSGIILLEAYSEDLLARKTGVPKDADMLMTRDKIERELPSCEPILLRELEREVCESTAQTGIALVV